MSAIVYVDPRSWWPPWQSLDAWRAERLATGEAPTYWTPEREKAAHEFGVKAGLKRYPMPHEDE